MRDDGFTLLETLVATFIFALVSASAVMLLTSMQRGEGALAAADARTTDLQVANALLRGDLMAALPRPIRGKFGDGLPVPFKGREDTEGPLFTLVRGNYMGALVAEDTPAIQRVAYILEDGALVRRAYARPDITPETPYTDQRLIGGITALELRFWGNGQWVPEWTGSTLRRESLPRMLKLDITFAGGQALAQVFRVGEAL